MNFSKFILLLFIAIAALQSCYYDVEERLYPAKACDTSNVTLATKVKANVLNPNCYSCHSVNTANASGGGINLETYASLKAQVDNGKLLKSIKHEYGASAMPKNSTNLMDACSIKIIEIWVAKGAMNN